MSSESFVFYTSRSNGVVSNAELHIDREQKKISLSDWSYAAGKGGYEDEYYVYVSFSALENLRKALEKTVQPLSEENFTEEQKSFYEKEGEEEVKKLIPYLTAFYGSGKFTEDIATLCSEENVDYSIWQNFDFDDEDWDDDD